MSVQSLLCLACALVLFDAGAHAQLVGREKVLRGVQTARYEVAVQKSATMDIRLANGAAVVEDAWCAVQLAGDEQPRRLKLDARTGQRDLVAGRLGQGKSLLLGSEQFAYAIHTYETQPFFTITMGYANDTGKPVTVERLVVLAGKSGEESGLMLGTQPQQTKFLAGTGDVICTTSSLTEAHAEGTGLLAAWNPASGRVFAAGFLGLPLHSGRFTVATTGDSGEEDGAMFSVEWVPEHPVELPPDATLEIPPLYVSVAESDATAALRRFGRAFELTVTPLDAAAPEQCAGGTLQDCLERATRNFFLPPTLRPARDCLAQAMPDGAMRQTLLALLNESKPEDGTACYPGLGSTAFPSGLFEAAAPDWWVAPMDSPAGAWQVYALFNWDSQNPVTRKVPVPADYHTVFDFWAKTYLGTAANTLEIEVPPGSVRVVCLRPYRNEPMIVGSDHIANGGIDILSSEYNVQASTLAVQYRRQGSHYVLVPEGYVAAQCEAARYTQEGRIVRVDADGPEGGTWSLVFSTQAIAP